MSVTKNTCRKEGHTSKECYKNAKCPRCHRIGHTQNVCRSKQINYLLGVSSANCNLKFVDAIFAGVNVSMLVDTGVAISVLNSNFVVKHNLSCLLKSSNETAFIADGRKSKKHSFVYFCSEESVSLMLGIEGLKNKLMKLIASRASSWLFSSVKVEVWSLSCSAQHQPQRHFLALCEPSKHVLLIFFHRWTPFHIICMYICWVQEFPLRCTLWVRLSFC